MLLDHALRQVRSFPCGVRFCVFGVYDPDYVKIHLSVAFKGISHNIVGIPDRCDDDGCARLLCDLKGTRMEGVHVLGFAAGAFGVYADGAYVLRYDLRRTLYDAERLSVVVPVEGEAAALVHQLSADEHTEVALFRYVYDAVLIQRRNHDGRVKERPVVADDEETAVGGDLLLPRDVYLRT